MLKKSINVLQISQESLYKNKKRSQESSSSLIWEKIPTKLNELNPEYISNMEMKKKKKSPPPFYTIYIYISFASHQSQIIKSHTTRKNHGGRR